MKIKTFLLAVFLLFLFGYSTSGNEWNDHKCQHFIIYHKGVPLDFVLSVEKSAEQYYMEITENLGFTRYKGWHWDDRAKIYIYNDAQDYVQSGNQAGWSHGVASPQSKEIRTFPSAHGFFDSTLPHELGHIIFREFIGFNAQIPTWFEEGVAMYQEKAKRWGAHDSVRTAMADETFKPLGELSLVQLKYKSTTDVVNLFYAESASIVNFLIQEYGQQRFVRLCRKLKDGDPFEWALSSIYVRFKNIDDLNAEWMKYLKHE